ncbi:YitT family protein [Bacillus sp. S/N-304-OC-R1]|uniref:YitT family protein n=1 Tax=Bacillus sp. S/N-304-OC-R1 TaxID=2758034 RepID=UPI0021AFBD01|nr:YitT family protein [Bacillus sp. S/N-304-OC-R1]MBY0123823.1 YitT family protein [Bacillus sp. S/N-304-OC-R1]
MIGNILITIAYAILVVPNEIINGGVTSLALIVNALTGGGIAMLANIVTLLLLVLCLIFLGKEYFLNSIFSSLFYIVFFNFFYSFHMTIDLNIIASIILASILIAIGYYLCISSHSTTVGVDVIALILHHRNNKINIAIAIRCINFIVLSFGFSFFGWTSIMKGVVFTFVYSFVLKKLLARNQATVKGTIKKLV